PTSPRQAVEATRARLRMKAQTSPQTAAAEARALRSIKARTSPRRAVRAAPVRQRPAVKAAQAGTTRLRSRSRINRAAAANKRRCVSNDLAPLRRGFFRIARSAYVNSLARFAFFCAT